jgi:hypothetical protein
VHFSLAASFFTEVRVVGPRTLIPPFAEGELSFRLARGFSIEFEATASRIRDRLSLPRRGATPEEVLLRVRQLQSGHEIRLSFGGSYSFGSIFNNIVNPRFGR